jgi:hypothetical protein
VTLKELPANDRPGVNPVNAPVVEPAIVTSSARAVLWLNVKMAIMAMLNVRNFMVAEARVLITSSVILGTASRKTGKRIRRGKLSLHAGAKRYRA